MNRMPTIDTSNTTPGANYGLSKGRNIGDYLDMLMRRKKIFLPILLIGGIISAVVAKGLPSIYRSTATILIEQQEIPEELVKSTITTYADQRIQEISKRVMTNNSLQAIIEKYDLYADYKQQLPMPRLIRKMRSDISLNMSAAEVKKGKRLRAQPTIAFEIAFDYAKQPEIAKEVVSDLVDLFLKENERDRKKSAKGTFVFLSKEVKRLEAEAAKINLKLAEFKTKHAGMLPTQAEVNQTIAERIERDLAEVDRQLFDLKQRDVILNSDLRKVSKYSAAPSLTNELGEQVMSAEGRIQVLRSTYVSLLSKYSPQHPKMKKIKNELAQLEGGSSFGGEVDSKYRKITDLEAKLESLRQAGEENSTEAEHLKNEINRLKAELGAYAALGKDARGGFSKELNPAYVSIVTQMKVNAVELQSLKNKKHELIAKQAEIEKGMLKSPVVETEYNKLDRQYEAVLQQISNLRVKQNAAEISEKLESSQKGESFRLFEAPLVPFSPIKPNRLAIFGLGLLISFGAGFGVTLLVESTDRRVYNNQVMNKVTGVQPLSVVPYIPDDGVAGKFTRSQLKMVFLVVSVLTFLAFYHVIAKTSFLSLDTVWDGIQRQLELATF